ncbi:MAG: rieske domain protein [Solirubrobacteraceae bacterium]|nr:rieske domain protein [Solirubrobacteraceae bacterium]
MTWHRALATEELLESTPTPVHIEGRDLCLVRLGHEIHAFDDACPHRQWPLHLGWLDGSVLRCRAHTWEWDVRSGALQRMRAPECLTMHAARERDGAIEVQIAANVPARKLSALWRATQSHASGTKA